MSRQPEKMDPASWKDHEEGATYTTIHICTKNENVQVKMEFWPAAIDPKNITFDQMCGSVGVAAIAEFIRTGEPPKIPPPPIVDDKN